MRENWKDDDLQEDVMTSDDKTIKDGKSKKKIITALDPVEPDEYSETLVSRRIKIPVKKEEEASAKETPSPEKAKGEDTISSDGVPTILPRLMAEANTIGILPRTDRRYKAHKKLDEGEGDETELLVDQDINRFVTRKKLKQGLQDHQRLMKFIDEIQTAGALDHPNIIPIYDVGRDEGGQFYSITKHVEGETLESIIHQLRIGNEKTHNKFRLTARISICKQILKAVAFAHHKGVLHRDIRPANILVGTYGEVMVIGWEGSTRLPQKPVPEELTENVLISENLRGALENEKQALFTQRLSSMDQNSTIGTPAYMAPEQVRKDQIDERTDIYSLCALFYEFLTLQQYLKSKSNPQETVQGILNEKPKKAHRISHKFQPKVPVDLSHILTKGLAKSPAKRYQSISEILEILHHVEQGLTPVQCPYTLMKRWVNSLLRLLDKHPLMGSIIIFSFTLTLIFGIYSLITLL